MPRTAKAAEDDLDQDVEVDPREPMPVHDKIRKNIWLSNALVRDLEDLVREDEEANLTSLIRKALKKYVRARKEGRDL